MKHGRKPTLKQKIAIKNNGYNPDNWLVIKKIANELHLVHRYIGTLKKIIA